MRARNVTVGVICLALISPLWAADQISGKWTWESPGFGPPGMGQPMKTTLTLKAEGNKLTGTITVPAFREPGSPPAMEEVQISNGKVEGNNIYFEVTREFMGTTRTTKYEGVLSGGELKIKIIQMEVTAKRVQ